MRNVKYALVLVFSMIVLGCKVGNGQLGDGIIRVDMYANYPEKEMILQDFMDVEYIALESTDNFITKGIVKAVGKNIILVTNSGRDGDIFVFDRATGKGLRKINRMGQGGEEYSLITEIVLDEDNDEMFVVDYPVRVVLVYDLYGNYKRKFEFADESYYDFLYNYDRDHLLCFKSYLPAIEGEQSCHILVSKLDGSITQNIQLPYEQIETPVVINGEMAVTPAFSLITPSFEDWLVTRASSDTVYSFLQDGRMKPFIVRTPSVHSMMPKIFLFPCLITNRYYFMYTLKKEVDFETFKGFLGTNLVYDEQENAIFQCKVYNDDVLSKKEVVFNINSVSKEVANCQVLEAGSLVELYGENKLKGELREIAAKLDEDSNPVLMLVKHKK